MMRARGPAKLELRGSDRHAAELELSWVGSQGQRAPDALQRRARSARWCRADPASFCRGPGSAARRSASLQAALRPGHESSRNNIGRILMIAKLILAAVAAIAATQVQAQTPKVVMEEMMVPSVDSGIEIYVRNKRPADMTAFRPERTVLYVHGATYPASTSFDLPLDGFSWMDYLAARGYDVYLLDVRGYGRSTRPPHIAQPPAPHPPILRPHTALKDIRALAPFLL